MNRPTGAPGGPLGAAEPPGAAPRSAARPAPDAAVAVPEPGGAGDRAPGFHPYRTLPLRVEAVRQLLRRRTLVAFTVVMLLPVVVWAAFAIGGTPHGRANVPSLMDAATSSGVNFALAVLFVSSGFLLTLPVALFFGDTVASEASWSSLRYLLAAPVPRARLLAGKALVALAFSAVAVLLLPAVALLVGTIAYGWRDLQLPSAGSVPVDTAVLRFAAASVFVFASQLALGALAFWLSTVTDAPLGAVGGAVGAAILSNILDAITALGSVRSFLPTHWLYSWVDALQPSAQWSGMAEGLSVSVSYAIVFTALAFRGFRGKDVVS